MKKIFVMTALVLLFVGFVSAISLSDITGSAVDEGNQNATAVQAANRAEIEAAKAKVAEIQARAVNAERVQNIIKAENRLRVAAAEGECPERCECDGATIKCSTENGREMTITAGESGKTIVKINNAEMQTKAVLYQDEDGKVYGVFKNNETRTIGVLPDEVVARIRARINASINEEEIELDEDGNYQVEARKRARLFGIIPVSEKVRIEMDSETGEIIRTRTSWWAFLATDVGEESEDKSTTEETSPAAEESASSETNTEVPPATESASSTEETASDETEITPAE